MKSFNKKHRPRPMKKFSNSVSYILNTGIETVCYVYRDYGKIKKIRSIKWKKKNLV